MPDPSDSTATDSWLDAVALVEAVLNEDDEAARVLIANTATAHELLGCVLQLLDILLAGADEAAVRRVLARARMLGPPQE